MKRILILTVGWTFVVLGVLGLFLPVLQGILFLAIGFIILSKESRMVRGWTVRLRRRFPIFNKVWKDAERRAEKIRRKFRKKSHSFTVESNVLGDPADAADPADPIDPIDTASTDTDPAERS